MNVVVRRVIRLGSAGEPTSSKYRNKPTEVEGIRFDSKKEARRWTALRLLESQGAITNLRRQVPFELKVAGKLICRYKADFVYDEKGKQVVEDVKGQTAGSPYRLFTLKKKLMAALHGIDVQEV